MLFWIPICTPRGLPNATIGVHFSPKRAPKWSPPNEWDPPEADLGAIWRRKRSKDAFSSIRGRFLVDFGWIFNEFRLIFDVVLQDFDAVLT